MGTVFETHLYYKGFPNLFILMYLNIKEADLTLVQTMIWCQKQKYQFSLLIYPIIN